MVLFADQDASGNPDLWVTDGTSELTVAGSFATGFSSTSTRLT
jgi:hypothetical protein